MSDHADWRPCDIHLMRGQASFDDLHIEADPITDPRTDRVFPIVEEEQVLVCREMLPRLQAVRQQLDRPVLLDVGTGSGVFALWAARQGLAAWGIDMSERAIDKARHNARLNGIEVSGDAAAIAPGQVFFSHETFDAAFAEQHSDRFDLVLVNPPYNPTCPGVHPALHAAAGEDGQEAFRDQVRLVPRVLRSGGYCIGNQFTTVDTDGEMSALREMEAAFSGQCRLRYARMVADDVPARVFLEGIYETYLQTDRRPGRDVVRSYIARVCRSVKAFALLYFELNRCEPLGGAARRCSRCEFALQAPPPRDWQDRIEFHRYVVDYVTPEP